MRGVSESLWRTVSCLSPAVSSTWRSGYHSDYTPVKLNVSIRRVEPISKQLRKYHRWCKEQCVVCFKFTDKKLYWFPDYVCNTLLHSISPWKYKSSSVCFWSLLNEFNNQVLNAHKTRFTSSTPGWPLQFKW